MYVYDPATTKMVQVNKAAALFFGYSEEEMQGMSVMDLVYADDVAIARQMAEEVLEDSSNSHAELLRFQKKTGEMVYVELYGTSINLDGKYLRSVQPWRMLLNGKGRARRCCRGSKMVHESI